MVAVEVNDLTFAIGLYLLYYLIKNRPVPRRGWYLLAACFFFAVGLKRIALAGIAVALVVVLLCRFFKEDSRKRLLQFLSLGLIGFALLYILAIKTGVYEYLAQRYNIDTMGRITLIHLIDEYYSFSPLFKGFGLGYTVEWLASEEIQEYFNQIPASSYTKEEEASLRIPLMIQLVKDKEVIYTKIVRKNVVSAEQMKAEYDFDFKKITGISPYFA